MKTKIDGIGQKIKFHNPQWLSISEYEKSANKAGLTLNETISITDKITTLDKKYHSNPFAVQVAMQSFIGMLPKSGYRNISNELYSNKQFVKDVCYYNPKFYLSPHKFKDDIDIVRICGTHSRYRFLNDVYRAIPMHVKTKEFIESVIQRDNFKLRILEPNFYSDFRFMLDLCMMMKKQYEQAESGEIEPTEECDPMGDYYNEETGEYYEFDEFFNAIAPEGLKKISGQSENICHWLKAKVFLDRLENSITKNDHQYTEEFLKL